MCSQKICSVGNIFPKLLAGYPLHKFLTLLRKIKVCKVVLKEFRINIFRQFLNTHWKTIALVTPPSTCGGLWNKTNSTSMTSITSNVAHLVVSPKVQCGKNEEKVLPKKIKIVLPFRFYVKSIFTIMKVRNWNFNMN